MLYEIIKTKMTILLQFLVGLLQDKRPNTAYCKIHVIWKTLARSFKIAVKVRLGCLIDTMLTAIVEMVTAWKKLFEKKCWL